MLVLVHPELKDDPVNQQGQVGMLLYANTEKDDIYVAFGQGLQGLYSSNAVLVPKSPRDIYSDLLTDTKNIPAGELKTLYRVGMLLDNGRSESAKQAMRLLAENPQAIPRAMITLQERLGLEESLSKSREQPQMVGRGR